jgi:peptidoglycan/xylan/chitin deacetylase (PgdA/CDA1 family)
MIVGLSHDVDSIRKDLRHVWRVRGRFTVRQLLLHALGVRNLYDNLADLMEVEEERGVRSTFFIPAVLFNLDEVEGCLKQLVEGGWEVGLHFVVEGRQLKALLRMERRRLEDLLGMRVEGVRTHNLAVDEGLLKLYGVEGFIYDSSLRAEEVGRSSPFKVEGAGGLVECPIGVMDADLFGRLHLSEEGAFRWTLSRVEEAEGRGEGAFTLLFHQESLSMKGGRIYVRLLDELLKRYSAAPLRRLVEAVERG